ncbi:hypothetical protein OSTOST_25846, partial [Ostertagia ostertagi]
MRLRSLFGPMRFLSVIIGVFLVLMSSVITVESFNVPPVGVCKTGKGGNCMRCDCNKPLSCYKGTCR